MGEVLGTIHIPRYLVSVAAGMPDRIPVFQSKFNNRTPENQLVAEGLERSLAICRDWLSRGGAEAKLAREIQKRLNVVARTKPWPELMNLPRPPLRPLAAQVRTLIATKVIPREPYNEMSLLLGGLTPESKAMAFSASAGLLSMLITAEPLFEDKLFELLCLAWIISALSRKADASTLQVFPGKLKGAAGMPVAQASIRGKRVRLFFQSGVALPSRNWNYVPAGNKLGAIFDILCQITSPDQADTTNIIVDAKNRAANSEGEVAYKMLGYKENVMDEHQRFLGLAIFPSDQDFLKIKSLQRAEHRLWLAYAPLAKGERTMRLFSSALGNHRFGF
jgi:hypothetical protein